MVLQSTSSLGQSYSEPGLSINTQASPISVSAFVSILNTKLKSFRARIVGEVCELVQADSGHVYFTLKDKQEDCIIKCIVWKPNYNIQGVQLQNGLEVILGGSPQVYSVKGRLSFVADTIELVGEGQLKAAYDALKQRLSEEGIFSDVRKKIIQPFPQKIGIITSRQGAVIHDFTSNLGKWGFHLTFCDSRVEGKEALTDLINSIRTMANQDVDVLVLMRGGGPMQSLVAFDNEALVREIIKFPVPVLAAIGHHRDIPLAALAADVQVSTPTAAANFVNRSWEEADKNLIKFTTRITSAYQEVIHNNKNRLNTLQSFVVKRFSEIQNRFEALRMDFRTRLGELLSQINFKSQILEEFLRDIMRRFSFLCKNYTDKTRAFERIIESNNPMRQLKLGFSIVQYKKKVLKSISKVVAGDEVNILMADGRLLSKIQQVVKGTNYG